MSSILNRRGTFLSREEWTTRPFDEHPMSMMQRLLNKACELPTLLERFDEIIKPPNSSNLDMAKHLCSDFRALLASLQEWELKSTFEATQSLVWSSSDPNTWSLSSTGALWFPNMMAANSLTHYWAFEIVARTHLSSLHRIISAAEQNAPQTYTRTYAEALDEISLLSLADKICDSTSYLLQPKFKFHGLWSAYFTLPTALRVFKQEQELNESRIERCQWIEGLLASREVYFPGNQ